MEYGVDKREVSIQDEQGGSDSSPLLVGPDEINLLECQYLAQHSLWHPEGET